MPMKQGELRYAHSEGHTDVCYFEDGEQFVTCGADGDIRIWSVDESVDPIHNCVGEWALAIRQKDDQLFVATGSNDIQILKLPEGDRNGVLDRFVAPINHIAVSKKGQLIAFAGEDMEVKLRNVERDNKEIKVFEGATGPCLSVAICPNSKFVASASGDTHLRIWDIENSTLVKKMKCFPKVNSFANAQVLCRIDFEPIHGKHLAYPDKNTVIILTVDSWAQQSTLGCDSVSADLSIVEYSPCGRYIAATSLNGDIIIWDVASESIVSTGKHEKSIAICGLMWNPKGNGEIIYTDVEGQLNIISEAIEVDLPMADIEATETVENDVDLEVQFQDDGDEDNENAISVEKLKRDILGTPDSELKNLGAASSRSSTPRPRTPVIPVQPPFMPSSTPEHLDPRYMCWNEVAVIRSYGHNSSEETSSRSIEVEFHDSTFHNSMMMQNYQEYTMGSVSKAALVVANSSQINVIPLSGSSKDWILKMEDNEEIILIASSENIICFAMSHYIIRICSIFGNQRAVVSVPGPLVSISAHNNVLMVAYHTAGVRDEDQCIHIKLFTLKGMIVYGEDIGSALGPKSTLSWLGFSDMGTPAMMDSLGMLSLYPQSCNTWIPYCDMTKHQKSPADGFFVTTVFESYQAVGGIKCKGTVYPGFTPRPTMCELPLQPPFAESGTEKTQMEMNLFTWSTLQVGNVDKKLKETALKTFALACRNNLDERAFELMEILENPQVVMLGLKYATKLERKRLAEKLMILAGRLAEENDDLGVAELATPEPAVLKPIQRKLTLSSSKHTPKNRAQKENEANTPEVQRIPQNMDTSRLTESNDSQNSTTLNSQSSFTPGERPNPFLKSLKKGKINATPNPLSLTDTYAGVTYEKEGKRNNQKNSEVGEKRKLSDSDSEKQKEKQRKLDCFKFTKKAA